VSVAPGTVLPVPAAPDGMTAPADLVLTDAEVHTLADPDRTHGAVAVRDGRIVRLGDPYDVDLLVGADTRVLDCGGRVVLPGFVDAHTHMLDLGARLVHADLSGASDRAAALDALADRAAEIGPDDWLLGYGYDESAWPADEREPLTRADLDGLGHPGPVAAVREDMHLVSLDGRALDALDLPAADVRREGGEPTGVVVEDAAEAVREAVTPGREGAHDQLRAAIDHALARGVTAVHDMVRRSPAPRLYRDLERAGELPIRVRLNYWADHLDAVAEVGLATGTGGRVRTGAIKTYTDGSLGGHTARLSEPYADAPGERGEWVVEPDALAALVERVDGLDLQAAAHAIGDEAVDAVLDAYAGTADPAGARHRIEHAELADAAAIERMADLGVVASVQPNFLRWAGEGGLYAARIGERRTRATPIGDLVDAGVRVAFGSDCMPLDPLFGLRQAVEAPTPAQRLGPTEALRAYTSGAAYAAFDEARLGTVTVGTAGDLVVLDGSPWDDLGDCAVRRTVVGGEVVYEADGAA
jgi:predicted amidohydrolase YtcJ